MPADPAAVKAIFLEAAGLPPADRAAFLAERCGADADLLRRVHALLAAHDRAGEGDGTASYSAEVDFAATHSPDDTRSVSPSNEAVGQVIAGRYKLIERIGEGGMGSVWMAEQTEPVKRKVAVKLIKPGLDSKTVLARFEAERQALALMNHENIAKVFDGGLHDGRPYFVMELVKGVPITAFCDARRLTPQQRLELFVPVCQAIQHAHQKGVIHRDIRPVNVLVALYDDRPIPKVIDFGVAKATGPTLTEHTLNTGFGAVVGTPQYMSPEQATFNNLDIDTRSDVYSLGVLLYELLAGSPPFKRQELEKRGLLEMLRVVREEEPPRPSTKLSTADALPSLAASRGTEPKKLTGLLRNELDWIVMKALEKDRTRRYDTANGFAADVQRYLSGEPVQAHPPTAGYRLRKFVRKHKGPVLASAMVFLTLLLGIAGTTFGLVQADERRREAEQAKRREEGQRVQAEESAAKARAALDRGTDILDAVTSGITDAALNSQKELTPEQQQFMSGVLGYYAEFAAERSTDPEGRRRAATAAYRVGIILRGLYRFQESTEAWAKAVDLWRSLAAEQPTAENQTFLAHCVIQYGSTLALVGRYADALDRYDEAIRLVADSEPSDNNQPLLVHAKLAKARLLPRIGRAAEAVAIFIGELKRAEASKDPAVRKAVLSARRPLATILAESDALDESERLLRDHAAELAEPTGRTPVSRESSADAAATHLKLAEVCNRKGDKREAEGEYRAAADRYRQLAEHYPGDMRFRGLLAAALDGLADLLAGDRPPESLSVRRELADVFEHLVTDFPSNDQFKVKHAGILCNLGIDIRQAGKPADSLSPFERAIATLRPLLPQAKADPRIPDFLANSYQGRAVSYALLGRHAEAVADWDRAIELGLKDREPRLRAGRTDALMKARRVAEAVAEVAELRQLPGWSAARLYNFACVYAVASGKIVDQKAEHADTAIEILQKAVKAGWSDAAHMKADTDLDTLRGRDDFKKLLADLEAKFPPKKEVLPPPRADK